MRDLENSLLQQRVQIYRRVGAEAQSFQFVQAPHSDQASAPQMTTNKAIALAVALIVSGLMIMRFS